MHVNNFTQDLSQWKPLENNGRGACGSKMSQGTISNRAYQRILREAKGFLDGYGIDFSQLDDGEIDFFDMTVAQVTWRHKETGNEVCVTGIWFEHKTGEILQYGTQNGALTY